MAKTVQSRGSVRSQATTCCTQTIKHGGVGSRICSGSGSGFQKRAVSFVCASARVGFALYRNWAWTPLCVSLRNGALDEDDH
jgi:hypothetical protein